MNPWIFTFTLIIYALCFRALIYTNIKLSYLYLKFISFCFWLCSLCCVLVKSPPEFSTLCYGILSFFCLCIYQAPDTLTDDSKVGGGHNFLMRTD